MEGITKYYDGEPAPNEHTENHCDRCGALVGKKHLKAVSFLYMDKNDKNHIDMSPLMRYHTGRYYEPGYRQYYCCKECWE